MDPLNPWEYDDAQDRDMEAALLEQSHELLAFSSHETDLDLAFRLQLEEALDASLSLAPSSSSPLPPPAIPQPETLAVPEKDAASLQAQEIARVQQEMSDRKLCLAEANRRWYDLHRRIHDQNVAREIDGMSDSEWEEIGDEYEDPFGPDFGINSIKEASVFRIYFKGLVGAARLKGSGAGSSSSSSSGKADSVSVVGLGVAICDTRDNVLFEIRKPLVGTQGSKMFAEFKALIEGLNAAVALELKNIDIYCDYFPLYQLVVRRWKPRQRKVGLLLDQVWLLFRKNFFKGGVWYVPRKDIQHAFKLARDAVDSFDRGTALPGSGKVVNETCVICAEDIEIQRIFSVDECKHRYCISCMKQHVEAKLLHGVLPKCPHEGCKSDLGVESCQKFLTPKLIETLRQRIKEASIPATEKVYCPYPRCSALMSKAEITEYLKDASASATRSGATRCLKCQGLFCINCKVPWHSELTCSDYKRLNPGPPAEDVKLKNLARVSLWRQCIKCNHMIELAEGCYHMTCRCGYEFCYNCGAEWKDKKATCSCPLWEEDNIWSGEDEEDFEEEDDDDYTDSESDYDDYI